MKSIIYNSCKILALTAIASSLSISLVSTGFTQEAPAKRVEQPDIQLQKVDGPRKTGRQRATGQTQKEAFEKSERQLRAQGSDNRGLEASNPSDAINTKSTPSIRRLDPDKVQELRARIRSERSTRLRDTQFQDERAKNIRRLVQIERVRELAEQNDDKVLLERASQLRDKEIQRHTRKLAKLRKQGIERRQGIQKQNLESVNSQQDK